MFPYLVYIGTTTCGPLVVYSSPRRLVKELVQSFASPPVVYEEIEIRELTEWEGLTEEHVKILPGSNHCAPYRLQVGHPASIVDVLRRESRCPSDARTQTRASEYGIGDMTTTRTSVPVERNLGCTCVYYCSIV